ncbi:hypothetical protein L2E82_27936 [Cichorium intybus]|uniref:Uncharacterized protein n=1 Tax=Cichorium intybus TaxID=13427 RepID=A0ACB9CUI6_CICIN|nr:hypothetical protein L2E82_27936 [Cichorium intybus]
MLITEDIYIKFLDKCPDIKLLKKIHCRLIIDGNLVSASHIALKLMKAYSESRQIAVTRQLFNEFPQKDVVFFNVMIRSYVNNEFYEKALGMYRSMFKFNINPDHFTVPQVLKACSVSENLWVGLQTHVAVLKKGLHSNLYVGNGLITMYGKCNRLVEGRKVFDEMPSRDVVSWNAMVAAYAQNQMFNDALEYLREKRAFLVMGFGVIVCLFILLGFNNMKCSLGEIGTASSYEPPYTPTRCNGNQADQFPLGNLFVSVSEGLWDNGAACGRRYRLKCLSGNNKPCKGGTIDVKVVDFCSKRPCPSTVVLSSDAFSAISKSQTGKINVEYVEI